MGFVRVSGYNEEDLERARREGAGSVDIIPNVRTKSSAGKNTSTFEYNYYPSKNDFSTHKCVVCYTMVLDCDIPKNPQLEPHDTDAQQKENVDFEIKAIREGDSNAYKLWDKNAWGTENVITHTGDTSLGNGRIIYGITILPARVRVMMGTKAKMRQENRVAPISVITAFVYENEAVDETNVSTIDLSQFEDLINNVTQGQELMCLANSQAEAEQIAQTVGITLVSYDMGVATFTTTEDLDTVIARARGYNITLSPSSAASTGDGSDNSGLPGGSDNSGPSGDGV